MYSGSSRLVLSQSILNDYLKPDGTEVAYITRFVLAYNQEVVELGFAEDSTHLATFPSRDYTLSHHNNHNGPNTHTQEVELHQTNILHTKRCVHCRRNTTPAHAHSPIGRTQINFRPNNTI